MSQVFDAIDGWAWLDWLILGIVALSALYVIAWIVDSLLAERAYRKRERAHGGTLDFTAEHSHRKRLGLNANPATRRSRRR